MFQHRCCSRLKSNEPFLDGLDVIIHTTRCLGSGEEPFCHLLLGALERENVCRSADLRREGWLVIVLGIFDDFIDLELKNRVIEYPITENRASGYNTIKY